jgi:hypothetical protein
VVPSSSSSDRWRALLWVAVSVNVGRVCRKRRMYSSVAKLGSKDCQVSALAWLGRGRTRERSQGDVRPPSYNSLEPETRLPFYTST